MNTTRSILLHLLVATAIALDTSTMNVVMHFQLGRLSVVADTLSVAAGHSFSYICHDWINMKHKMKCRPSAFVTHRIAFDVNHSKITQVVLLLLSIGASCTPI